MTYCLKFVNVRAFKTDQLNSSIPHHDGIEDKSELD